MRPISNVVDVTNYVMLGLGNPLHAFDQRTLAGGRIVVRRARVGEKLTTLDGVERELDPSDLMIADAERSVALAGIMGGAETEISEGTTEVLLEAANFEPAGLWRTSERLRLRTEGSNRWEKGVDPYLAEPAGAWATELLVGLTGARFVGHTDAQAGLPERPVVRFRPERASAFIGLDVAAEDQDDVLARLGNERRDDDYVVPTWRARDLTREVDLVEEVARFHLAEVPFTFRFAVRWPGASPPQRVRRRVRGHARRARFLRGVHAVPRRAGSSRSALPLQEPITVELAVLRTELLPSLVEVAGRNADLGSDEVALFEVARVYLPRGERELPDERLRVAGISQGGFLHIKGNVEALLRTLHADASWTRTHHPLLHPGKAAEIAAAVVGEVHPRFSKAPGASFELDLEELAAAGRYPVPYEDVITYPAVHQDIAVAVDEEVEVGALVDAAREAAGEVLGTRRCSTCIGVRRSARVGSPWRSTSRSSPPSGRSPTRRQASCGVRSSPRWPSSSAASSARKSTFGKAS